MDLQGKKARHINIQISTESNNIQILAVLEEWFLHCSSQLVATQKPGKNIIYCGILDKISITKFQIIRL